MGTWCLLEPGWDQSALEESQTPTVSVSTGQGCPVWPPVAPVIPARLPWAQCGNTILTPHRMPLAASGSSARGSRPDSLFPCVPVPWDVQKPRAQPCSGLCYLLGAINAIKEKRSTFGKRLWLLLLPGDAAGAAGSRKEQEETLAPVPAAAERAQISSHSCCG